MATTLKQLARQEVTADTTAAAITITGVLVPSFYVSVYVEGATDVFIVEAGGANATTGMRIATLTHETYGPFARADGAPLLYSTAPSACAVTLLAVTGES